MVALTMTFADEPMAKTMSFQRAVSYTHLGKATVHEVRSVGNMDAVGFNGQRRRIGLQLDAGKQIRNRLEMCIRDSPTYYPSG